MNDPAATGPYVIEFGDVWHHAAPRTISFIRPDKKHVCRGSERLAICFDRENGTLHKHGSEASVTKWYETTIKRFTEQRLHEMADDLELVVFPPTAECVAELNACIATTGRVLLIEKRLQEISEETPPESWPTVYPA